MAISRRKGKIMKVTFRTELNLNINMHRLMNECIDRLNCQWAPDSKNVEWLVRDSLEVLYDVDLYGYDNTNEVITVVTKKLLLWCLESNHIKEHNRIKT